MAKHRMTPKRRAALHKAQLASARKRRRSRNKRIAIGAGVTSAAVLGVGIAGYAGRDYIATLARGGPRHSAFDPLPTQLALTVGRSVTKVKKVKRGIPVRKGVFKVNTEGTALYVKRNRPNYDWHRRKGFVKGYEKKVRSKYDGMSPRTQRRRNAKRG